MASADTTKDAPWIEGWLNGFVDEHGLEKVSTLLLKYRAKADVTTAIPPVKEAQAPAKNDKPAVSAKSDTGFADASPAQPSSEASANFSACILLRDDHLILNEWLAYHHYMIGLRSVVIAIHPSNTAAISGIVKKWRDFGMEMDEWTDQQYMPASFSSGKSFVPEVLTAEESKGLSNDEKVRRNQERYRELRFQSQCAKHLRAEKKTWTLFIDADEFVAKNPLLVKLPMKPHPLEWPFLGKQTASRLSRDWKGDEFRCVKLPRLMFGTKGNDSPLEKTSIPEGFDVSKFETLRWRFRTGKNDKRNGFQKVIMDVSRIPSDDPMLKDHSFSVHRPSEALCQPESSQSEFNRLSRQPLMLNHYVGSWEHYERKYGSNANKMVRSFFVT